MVAWIEFTNAYYGKKLDPEAVAKWRCSKEAHPDSKYCERHMHRGRNHRLSCASVAAPVVHRDDDDPRARTP
ncbi:hypothetical protein HU200_005461 [Digitaria exilis]|uniref:Growth-regulating factor n=1 Tax=Digitaria exilis TaxID=1010633 RepID=A0A835FUD3_9POAL|nr:hypothetical protein HU200_005461 [Digitaria exilis]